MPFTLAHPAAALLLRGTTLPVAAVVAGTMAPDVPMFLTHRYGYHFTHSAAGIVSADPVLALAGLLVWFLVLRDPLVDVAPGFVRERIEPRARYTSRQWALAVPAVVLGAITHVVWDAFTHHGRWGVRHVAWLQHLHGSWTGAQWAQYGSSVFGMTVCAVWAALALRRLPRQPRAARVPWLGTRGAPVVVVLTVAAGIAAGLTSPEPGLVAAISQTAVVGTMILALGVLALACAWLWTVDRRVSRAR
ncbi:MAG: hypothetical protein JWP74_788 [Marmoricola sp.]|nr:hypothetical protein [Marmoricola sp.]